MDDTNSLIAVFKNSLLYTTAGRVTSIIPENTDSPLLMLGSLALSVCLLRRAQTWAAGTMWASVGSSDKRATDALKDLILFLLDTVVNLAVQIVSTVAGQLITAAVIDAESTVYSICGAVVAVVLLWLLNKIVARKLVEGVG